MSAPPFFSNSKRTGLDRLPPLTLTVCSVIAMTLLWSSTAVIFTLRSLVTKNSKCGFTEVINRPPLGPATFFSWLCSFPPLSSARSEVPASVKVMPVVIIAASESSLCICVFIFPNSQFSILNSQFLIPNSKFTPLQGLSHAGIAQQLYGRKCKK